MTRTTKRAIWIIVIGLFALAAVLFVLWGSHGGTEWDTAKWFDYWGKGSPKQTATVPDKLEEAGEFETQVLASAAAVNAGLVYDSEDAVATVDVHQLNVCSVRLNDMSNPAPSSIHQKTNFSIQAPDYIVGNAGSHSIPDWDTVGQKSVVTLKNYATLEVLHIFEFTRSEANYVNESGFTGYRYELSFDDISEYVPTTGITLLSFVTQNVGSDESLDSNVNTYNFFFSYDEIETTFEDTVVSFVFPDIEEYGSFNAFASEIATSDVGLNYYETNFSATNYGYMNFLANSPAFDSNGYTLNVDLKDLIMSNSVGEYQLVVYFLPAKTLYPNFTSAINGVRFIFSVSQLSSPTNVRMENLTLKWDAVDGAAGYAVFLGEASGVTVTEPTYMLKDTDIEAGSYTVRVRALGNVGAQLASGTSLAALTPYNASNQITRLVVMNYSVEGDVVSKLVPYGSIVEDYLYDVDLPNKEFGGWFYDSGYSVKVKATDTLNKDVTIYARLTDVKVTERPLSWWDQYKWYVLIPAIAVVVIAAVVGGVIYVKKRK